MRSSSTPPTGYVPRDSMDPIEVGMTEDDVLSRIGEPFEKLSPEGVRTPSDVFASFGSMFRPSNDEGVDEIWIYRHFAYPHDQTEPRLTSQLGFANHVLQSFWKEEKPADEESIRGILTEFFQAMGEWEAACMAPEKEGEPTAIPPEPHQQPPTGSLAALQEIFKWACTEWEGPKRAKAESLCPGAVPSYGVDNQEIESVEVTEDTARVVTKDNLNPQAKYVYSFKRTGGRWWLEDDRTILSPDGVETVTYL